MTDHPTIGLVDVYAATIPTLAFKPGVHINYAETVLPMRDGLPKLKDFPAEFGGSGEAMAASDEYEHSFRSITKTSSAAALSRNASTSR